jgi:WD40 repeat protein/serine/threonine protein kinase/tetratricopeptide (TPR) repeat protein
MEVWRRGEVILDLYEVLDVVRTGGMGLVHRVHHQGWGIDLAVKTPRKALVNTPAAIRNFETEAAVWVGLGLHPHIASCAYVRTIDGVPRVFAEWADGGSLAEAIRGRSLYGDNALGSVLDVAIQCAWGLQHAHEQNVVHQDVKPANVMLTRDGTVKITDFGMARARFAAGERATDTTGPLVSHGGLTPAYCSPEQAAQPAELTSAARPAELTGATDVWSWAVTVFEMFLGRPAGQDGTAAGDLFAAFVRSGAHDADLSMPDVVADLLSRCFTTDPEARPSRLGPLADDLVTLYEQRIGPYPRRTPSAATLLADGLSNHALSMLDLNLVDGAEELWTRALRADPHHPHSRYNRGLHRWRTGQITDTELVTELAAVRFSNTGDWVDEYLLGLVHRERGAVDEAVTLLRDAAGRASGDPDVTTALASVEHAPAVRPGQLLTGHEDWIQTIALTPDGRIAASGDFTGMLRVWDVHSGRCTTTLKLDGYRITSLALRADGQVVVVAGGDFRGALVVDLATGRHLQLRDDDGSGGGGGGGGGGRMVALTPDGGHAVTLGHDGETIMWDLTTGAAVHVGHVGHVGHVEKAAVLGAQGALLVRIDYDRGRATIHDARTGDLLHSLTGFHTRVVLADNGSIAVADHGSAAVRLFDLTTGADGPVLHVGFGQIAVNADGTMAFIDGASTGQARLWELPTGRCRLTLDGVRNVKAIVLSADGRVVVTAEGKALRVRRLPPAGPRAPWSYVRPHQAAEIATNAERAAAALATATRLAGTGRVPEAAEAVRAARALPGHQRDAALVQQWRRLGSLGRRTTLVDTWPAGLIAAERAGSWAVEFNGRSTTVIARNGNDAEAWVFDIETGQSLHTLSLHTGHIGDIALSADGGLVVSGGEDGRVIAWKPRQGQVVQLFTSAPDQVYCVAVSEDGRVALSGTAGGTVAAWDIAAGRAIGRWQAHDGPVLAVAVSPDRRWGLSRGEDECVKVWDLRKASLQHTLRAHDGWIGTCRFSPDSQYVITGGADATAQIWRIGSGKSLTVLRGHTDAVVDAMLSPDGRLALSCSADGTVRLWDVGTTRCVHVLSGHTGAVLALAVTPDFSLAASGGDDRTVQLWDLPTGTRLWTLSGHVAAVSEVALATDGTRVLSGSRSGHLRTWALDWEYDFTAANPPANPAPEAKRAPNPAPADKAAHGELRDEVAVSLPTRADHGPGLVEAFARFDERHQRAVNRTLALADELGHIAAHTETGHWLYIHDEAKRREPGPAPQMPSASEGLALLLRPQAELSRSEAFWAEFFGAQLQNDLVLLAESAPLLHQVGDLAAAEQTWRLIVDVSSHLRGAAHPHTQTAMLGLSEVLADLRRQAEALVLTRAVADERTRAYGPDHPGTLQATARLASTLVAAGELDEAERIYTDLIPLLIKRYGSDDGRTLSAWTELAVLQCRKGRPRKAEKILRTVWGKRRIRLGEDHPDTLDVRVKLTAVLFDRNRRREAESHLRDLTSHLEQDHTPGLAAQIRDCADHPNRGGGHDPPRVE